MSVTTTTTTTGPVAAVGDRAWAEAWQLSFDRQQEGYMPDREDRFTALLDVVEAVGGRAPRVLDLACGTGSITRRLLARFPEARSVAVDVDPALLAIARATFAGDDGVTVVRADLADADWFSALPGGPFDAVVTATALHWLAEPVLRRLYRDLSGLVRTGGAVANADEMPPATLPRLSAAVRPVEKRRRAEESADGRPDWDAWWQLADTDPLLTDAVAERRARFGGDHAESFVPPSEWHVQALLDAGFAESGIVWRSHSQAAVAALR